MSIQELLHKYNNIPVVTSISDLFVADPDRFRNYSSRFEGLMLDFSKTSITDPVLDDLFRCADQAGLAAAVEALFSGEIVNKSEGRGAWHTLARAVAGDGILSRHDEIITERSTMLGFATSLRHGKVPAGNIEITDIIHLGIGGSALGPELVTDALREPSGGAVRLHFLASADGHAVTNLMRVLEPRNTVLIVASKSFSTRETLLNATLLKEWLVLGGVNEPAKQMIAITAKPDSASNFGITNDQILKLWPEIGGRYSTWSSIGLPVAIAIGEAAYLELLAGANAMDRHFRTAPARFNLPVLLALCGIWHRNVCGYSNLASVPYDDRLRLFPDWLQQLDMESNGKSVQQSGAALPYATAPTLIGGVGTIAQHSLFQALHQGRDIIPVEFIGVLQPDHDLQTHHRLQLGNMLAQGEALMQGRNTAQTRDFLAKCGLESSHLETQLSHRTFPGNRPSITLLTDDLSPYSLGQIMALYEHKVFVQSVLWNINAFDQWGVEYGKTLAGRYETDLGSATDQAAEPPDLLSYVQAKISR